MSNVLVEKNKLDLLATVISEKSGEPLKLTLDEMVSAVDGIDTSGGEPNLQVKTYTVDSAGTETVTADSGYDGLSSVIVNTPSGSVTGPTSTYNATMASNWGNNNGTLRVKVDNIPTTPSVSAGYVSSANSSSRSVYVPTTIPYNPTVTVSDNTVTIPNGYYPLQQTKTVSGGTPTLQNKTVTPTTSQQTVNADSGYDGLDTVTVNAMPEASLGVPTNSFTKTSTELLIGKSFPNYTSGYLSGINTLYTSLRLEDKTVTPSTTSQTVTPTSDSGYYLNSVTVNAMPSGTAGTPTATKGTVSNHSVSVTPSVTNITGYITGGTKNGTAVTVSASELVSGTKTITGNGTGIDVTNYASVDVAVQSGMDVPIFTVTYNQSTATVTCNKTYQQCDDLVFIDGEHTAVVTFGDGLYYPLEGFWENGTKIRYFGTEQGVPAYEIVYNENGTITFNYPSSVLDTLSVTSNGTYTPPFGKVYNEVVVNVPGGGTSKNAQVVQQSNTRITATTYTKACGDITVSKTGTYDVYWTSYRTSTSGTWGTQLYINGTAYGTAQTTFTSSYYQAVHLSNVSLTANQTVSVYGRSRGSNYYLYVGQLTIIEA